MASPGRRFQSKMVSEMDMVRHRRPACGGKGRSWSSPPPEMRPSCSRRSSLDPGGEKLALLYLDGDRRLIAIESHPVVERDEIVLPMARDLQGGAEPQGRRPHRRAQSSERRSRAEPGRHRGDAPARRDRGQSRHHAPRSSDLRRRGMPQLPGAGAALEKSDCHSFQGLQLGMSAGSGRAPRGSNWAK